MVLEAGWGWLMNCNINLKPLKNLDSSSRIIPVTSTSPFNRNYSSISKGGKLFTKSTV